MQHVVSKLSVKGKLTISQTIRNMFGLSRSTKAVVTVEDDKMIIEPKWDFWSLEGLLSSEVSLSDSDLKKARTKFSKQWSDV